MVNTNKNVPAVTPATQGHNNTNPANVMIEVQGPATITADNAVQNLVTEAKFNGMLKTIAKSGKELRQDVQNALMQSLLYMFIHNDGSKGTDLLNVIAENLSTTQFKQAKKWIESFSPYEFRKTENVNKEIEYKLRKNTTEKANAFDIETAYKTYWFQIEMFTQEEVNDQIAALFKLSNFKQRVQRLIKDAEKAMAEDRLDPDNSNAEEIKAIVDDLKTLAHVHGFDVPASVANNDTKQAA